MIDSLFLRVDRDYVCIFVYSNDEFFETVFSFYPGNDIKVSKYFA